MNNTPSNNHTTEPRDVASSSSNSTGINLPPRKVLPDSKFQRVLHTPLMTEPPGTSINQVGNKFYEAFQQKHGSYADLPAAKITELMKSSSLDNAPTQSLLSVVNGILEESVERRNGEIPLRVACLLRKVVQEIERRISTQQEHLRTQNNLFKTREEKYKSRISVLEALASGTKEESKVTKNENIIKEEKNAHHDSKPPIEKIVKEETKANDSMHTDKIKEEEEKKEIDKEVIRLIKEVEDKNLEKKEIDKEVSRLIKEVDDKNMKISTLEQDLETIQKRYEVQCSKMDSEAKNEIDKEVIRLNKEIEDKNMEISTLKQDLETIQKRYEVQCSKMESEAKNEMDKEVIRLNKEMEDKNTEISTLKQDLETIKKSYEVQCSKLELEAKDSKGLIKEVEDKNMEISTLKQELETIKKSYEAQCSKLESEVKDGKGELKQKSQEYEDLLEKLRNKLQESETLTKLKYEKWNMKQNLMQKAMNFQFGSIQQLKLSWESIKQDVMKEQTIYSEECKRFGVNLKPLVHAAENYHTILAENRKLFNELQELKGNIRVYCRIRPFVPGQKEKQSIVERIGESELVVANPSKKEALKTFKFNKIFGPTSSQAEVYEDIQAFIRSVLDGYNVCIFAYGQTGSGKTYTMSGPNNATNESVGVNYRALNDLFNISASRQSSIVYEIGVQIIEIYNEQVRDLLSTDTAVKKYPFCFSVDTYSLLCALNFFLNWDSLQLRDIPAFTGAKPLFEEPESSEVTDCTHSVPDASMHPVKSTADVIKLMDIGLKNRAKSSTAMNERSSRSHSVVSIHVRGADKKSGSTLVGNLHLVDLAGSERIDRSEVTGDRLKEAQHINKSLSALGDVIFALAQKSSHIPYRNSKLTQILQTALGGHAKTLMLVQITSDIKSYSESLSTLKFAERVSGVELGVAKSSKDGRDVRELMEQVASLKDTISTKDEEIERLQLLKDLKNVNSDKLED
ncbi:P-loop containing nucleoside triphosphate hydrolase superfamily protein [Trifolium repens]|nr:P-loop containing nucleoside triphosphate hydrolase superfamily protein [Trifolium repens]